VGRIPGVRRHMFLIVLAGVLVYSAGLDHPLLFDDTAAVSGNLSIRELSPISVPLRPPAGTTVAGRPLTNLTLAFDYAMGGLDVTAYRVTNLLIHLLAALVLYGVVRRRWPAVRRAACGEPRWRARGSGLRAAVGSAPAGQRAGRLCRAARVVADGPVLSPDALCVDSRRGALPSRPLDGRGGGGRVRRYAVARGHGDGAACRGGVRSRVPVRQLARGVGHTQASVRRSGHDVAGARGRAVVPAAGGLGVGPRRELGLLRLEPAADDRALLVAVDLAPCAGARLRPAAAAVAGERPCAACRAAGRDRWDRGGASASSRPSAISACSSC
jgi:hypothetical protein